MVDGALVAPCTDLAIRPCFSRAFTQQSPYHVVSGVEDSASLITFLLYYNKM